MMQKEDRIRTPVREDQVRQLVVGDLVYIDGEVCAFRDRAFERALELTEKGNKLPFDLNGAAHWHCGPITKKVGEKWVVTSAGPTTSSRFDMEEPLAIEKWGVRLVIGKGLGMGKRVAEAMKAYGAAYLSAIGGAASYYGKQIKEVREVHWLDLGMPEAVWIFKVENFGPLQVTMDAHGNNLYEQVRAEVVENLQAIYRKLGLNDTQSKVEFGEVRVGMDRQVRKA